MNPEVSVQCPICSELLRRAGRSYACGNRHNFDLSKEGYLSLLHGRGNYQQVGDDRRMIQARVHVHQLPAFLELAQVLAGHCSSEANRHGILDIGCGDGFFLDRIGRTAEMGPGVGLDISKEALARAARSHPGLFFIRTDAAHQRLPFGDASFGLVLSIFAPRPIDEISRVLRPDGLWLVVTATQEHLQELREFLPLAAIGTGKVEAMTSGPYSVLRSGIVDFRLKVKRPDLRALVEMSPSVHRLRRDFGEQWVERVPLELWVTFSFSVTLLGRPVPPPTVSANP